LKGITTFFVKNRNLDIDMTGGEPFLYPERIKGVLKQCPNVWTVNTNSQLTDNIQWCCDQLDVDRCGGICCSFHPHANQAQNFIKTFRYFVQWGRIPQINYVVSSHTIDRVYEDVHLLRSELGYDFHLSLIREISSLYEDPPGLIDDFDGSIEDFHRQLKCQTSKLKRKERKRIRVVQNKPRSIQTPRKCRYNREHMVLAPNGDLFPCSCFLYQNKNRICNVNKSRPMVLAQKMDIRTCTDSQCVLFHDQKKHINANT
jgi:hypothetical protein